jgi:sulfatase modifying factor 1
MHRPTNPRHALVFAIALILVTAASLAKAGSPAQVHASALPGTSNAFLPTMENRAPVPGSAPVGMVWIPGGEFSMGAQDPRSLPDGGQEAMADARPIHRVYIDGFWMDQKDVTNAQFERFVKATGYVTVAERKPRPEDFPGVSPEKLVPGSLVFTSPAHPVSLDDYSQWWSYVPGANWRHPLGPHSSIAGRANYPVVQIAYDDAVAYAKWTGKRLPTEAEWEFAARGGIEGTEYAWGSELMPGGRSMANIWYGEFPQESLSPVGYVGMVPVGSYTPNNYGLFDMIGNCWEWTSDWYQEHAPADSHCCGLSNPRGGLRESSINPSDPVPVPRKVMKGGSYLCAANYCQRYRPAARRAQPIDTATCHLGFRCVVRLNG